MRHVARVCALLLALALAAPALANPLVGPPSEEVEALRGDGHLLMAGAGVAVLALVALALTLRARRSPPDEG